jgi:hypothetical protein
MVGTLSPTVGATSARGLFDGPMKTGINNLHKSGVRTSLPTGPQSMPGLTAWYDFSDANYLTLVSTAISQVLDKSGNGNNSDVQSTGTKRPTLTAAALNGLSVATFDDGDTLIATAATSLFAIAGGASTVFSVAKRQSEDAVNDQIYMLGEGTSQRNAMRFESTAGSIRYLSRTADAGGLTSTGHTNTNYQIIMGRRSGTTQALAVNGGAEATNENGQDEPDISRLYIGSRGDIDAFLTGGIAELLFYNRSLSAAERNIVGLYLANKWGLYYPGAAWLSAFSSVEQELIASQKLTKEVATALFSSVVAWYRARSTSLTLVGTAITQMLDVSGNGNHTDVQGTATMRPTFDATGINGVGIANFDGGDQLTLPSSLYSIPNGSSTLFVVANRTSEDGTNDGIFCLGTGIVNKLLMLYPVTSGSIQYRSSSAGSGGVFSTGNTNTDPNIIMGRRSGTTQAIAVNGGAETSDSNASDDNTIDAGLIGRTVNNLLLTGRIAEIILFNTSLTADQINIIEAWLGTQYNITIA